MFQVLHHVSCEFHNEGHSKLFPLRKRGHEAPPQLRTALQSGRHNVGEPFVSGETSDQTELLQPVQNLFGGLDVIESTEFWELTSTRTASPDSQTAAAAVTEPAGTNQGTFQP